MYGNVWITNERLVSESDRAIGGDYLKKPTDDLESFSIDEYHDWAVVVKKGGANVYMLKGKRHYTELELIGHLDCGTVCFVELWNVHGNLGTYYKAFDKTGKVIGFVRWDDLDWYDRFIATQEYYDHMIEMDIHI